MKIIEEIKKGMKGKTLIVGYNNTVSSLKKNKLKLVVSASNAPEHMKKELENLSKIGKVEYVDSEKNNLELGATCRKSFGVSVLSIKK
ncbi:hypothetical protein COX58_01910 [archaeon CG_4_10_14_0_2_um_filter_Archaea_38_6]|nr:MAG: hypothetical protein COX58_01910 [archaeon CG_4_10_14_0_2_um_filter_Archaea_38_6]